MTESWHIIRCTSGQEGRAERYLERMGYPHGWHPTEKVRLAEAVFQRLIAAYRKLPAWAQGKPPKRYKTRPYVHGYVFLPAESVEVHKVNGAHPSVWMEVLCVNGTPYRLTDAQMAEMRSVPDRVRELVEAAERAAREAWEAKRPVAGEEGVVTQGLWVGRKAIVESVHGGVVQFDNAGAFGRIKFPQEHVERVA